MIILPSSTDESRYMLVSIQCSQKVPGQTKAQIMATSFFSAPKRYCRCCVPGICCLLSRAYMKARCYYVWRTQMLLQIIPSFIWCIQGYYVQLVMLFWNEGRNVIMSQQMCSLWDPEVLCAGSKRAALSFPFPLLTQKTWAALSRLYIIRQAKKIKVFH